nr:transglycosylase domain-containing protein [Bacteroidota bacterium]
MYFVHSVFYFWHVRLKTIIYTLSIIAFIIVAGFFLCRNYLLHIAFEKLQTKLTKEVNLNLTAKEINFHGLLRVEASDVNLYAEGADTLAIINEAACDIGFLTLIKGSIGLDFLSLTGVNIQLFDSAGHNNYKPLLVKKPKEEDNETIVTTAGYDEQMTTLFDRVFKLLETSFELNDISIKYSNEKENLRFLIPSAKYDLRALNAIIYASILNQTDTFKIKFNVVENRKKYMAEFNNITSMQHYLPFFSSDSSLKIKLQNMVCHFNIEKNYSNKMVMNCDLQIKNLSLYHFQISPDDITIYDAGFDLNCKIFDNTLQIDSSSKIILNKIYTSVFLRYDSKNKRQLTLQASFPSMQSQNFFDGLPYNMFSTLKGIKTSGYLSYNLFFDCNFNSPDSLTFQSTLKSENFKIEKYGIENLSRINNDFTFEALDGDRVAREIFISPVNPNYTPLNQIDTNLIHAVLTSEDGSFLYHNGFNEDAFRQSIITNIKEKRFARGGSTITMQLVKNCFLSRNKTISRKMEEVLIVWLIENKNIVSKQRMLEVYLNVIEWGPNIYGISEASAFYFDKKPSQLTLEESVFLASLVPRPKYFKYSFDKSGIIKPYMQSYYDLLKRKMFVRNWIATSDTASKQYVISLTGPAIKFITPTDSLPNDSLQIELNNVDDPF